MTNLFRIGELSQMTGVSTRTIRHYVDIGLLKCASVTDSRYRMFGLQEMRSLQQILLIKSFGFSLEEISEILTSRETLVIGEKLESKIESLEKEISKLNRSKELLKAVTRIYKTSGLDYISNFHLIKEMVTVNSKFIRVFNRLSLELQITVLTELYATGTLQANTLKKIGEGNGHLFLEELHMVLVKSLLNGVDFETEKNIMNSLRKNNPDFFKVAVKSMFTFDDFVRLPDKTIERWLLDCSDDLLIVALKDSSQYLVKKILSNMDKERADNIKDQLNSDHVFNLDETFTAMESLIDILRQLEMKGEIKIERFEY
ncbi:MerR family transcriptional regulator [Acidaminobacter sp. JC074]|uniref:FliG C-terminal domain-containing protein n=1 Tax=Acidaminobacter sp. JC074 TaxID=2530199 RepID=UPI001F0E4B0C|nr:FliG C-terminal domain-containing protein [Acidaminobacter sp. JC074]MCH4890595.1 MerR family transcriptional regulator [Acidaminobacter sp. JC074]